MSCRIPRCSKCGKKMIQKKKGEFKYWSCENNCIFIHSVWEEELTENEQKFLDELNN